MSQNESAVGLGKAEYCPPVEQLLRFGEPDTRDEPVDYGELGFGREHIPELIRMATDEALNADDPESDDVWAPLHAWRVLGKLRASEAVAPLLGLFRRVDEDQDDWVADDLTKALAEIGAAVIPPVAAYLADQTHGDWARVAAMRTIQLLGEARTELRSECVAVLTNQLERFAEQSESVNGSLVSDLLDLNAVEAAPVMEKAFASGRVDDMCAGDWEDVQIELGLKQERMTERKPNRWTAIGDRLRAAWGWGKNEKDVVFLGFAGTGQGVLRFQEGERAGQLWKLNLDCCSDPMCPCWTVNFECVPEGDDDCEPLCFSLCAKDRHLVKSPVDEVVDIKTTEFAKAVVKAFRKEDWRRLADYCEEEKEDLTDRIILSALEGRFPEKFLNEEMVRYNDVFPFARPFLFEHGGQSWMATDFYCIQRKSKGNEVFLGFLVLDDPKETAVENGLLVKYDYCAHRHELVHSGKPGNPPVKDLIAAMKAEYSKFRETAQRRHEQMKFLSESAMRKMAIKQQMVRAEAKVGRNDPCPCGSGKKFKKCCGK